MAPEANPSAHMENSVTQSTTNQDVRATYPNYYKPPEISKKTERELKESTERFMKLQEQQSSSGKPKDNAGFLDANSNGSYGNSEQVKPRDEGVDVKPAPDSTITSEKNDSGMS